MSDKFRQWFGNSKVVDDKGNPRVVYHGSGHDIRQFNTDGNAETTGNVTAPWGAFFSPSPAEASRYAEDFHKTGQNITPVHLSLQNPYMMPRQEWDQHAMAVFRKQKTQDAAIASARQFKQDLINQGHDGVIIGGRGFNNEYVAFHPTQIKSAIGNNGAYDPSNADITKKAGGTVTNTAKAIRRATMIAGSVKAAKRKHYDDGGGDASDGASGTSDAGSGGGADAATAAAAAANGYGQMGNDAAANAAAANGVGGQAAGNFGNAFGNGFGAANSNGFGVSGVGAPGSGVASVGPGGIGGVTTAGVTGGVGSDSNGGGQYGGTPGPSAYGNTTNAYGSNVSQPGGANTNSVTALDSQNQLALNEAEGLHGYGGSPGGGPSFGNPGGYHGIGQGNTSAQTALAQYRAATLGQLSGVNGETISPGGIYGIGNANMGFPSAGISQGPNGEGGVAYGNSGTLGNSIGTATIGTGPSPAFGEDTTVYGPNAGEAIANGANAQAVMAAQAQDAQQGFKYGMATSPGVQSIRASMGMPSEFGPSQAGFSAPNAPGMLNAPAPGVSNMSATTPGNGGFVAPGAGATSAQAPASTSGGMGNHQIQMTTVGHGGHARGGRALRADGGSTQQRQQAQPTQQDDNTQQTYPRKDYESHGYTTDSLANEHRGGRVRYADGGRSLSDVIGQFSKDRTAAFTRPAAMDVPQSLAGMNYGMQSPHLMMADLPQTKTESRLGSMTGDAGDLGQTLQNAHDDIWGKKANVNSGSGANAGNSGVGNGGGSNRSGNPSSTDTLSGLMANIAKTESGGWKNPYVALGPVVKSGDRAYGKYQVMGSNVPVWTKEVLGQSMTPSQFMNDPDAQEKVTRAKLGQYYNQYGTPEDAASMWFSGHPLAQGANLSDGNMTGREYARRATQGLGQDPGMIVTPKQAALPDPGMVVTPKGTARPDPGIIQPPNIPVPPNANQASMDQGGDNIGSQSNLYNRVALMPSVQSGYQTPQALFAPDQAQARRGGYMRRADGGDVNGRWTEGYVANGRGKTLAHNPHSGEEGTHWENGWKQAESETVKEFNPIETHYNIPTSRWARGIQPLKAKYRARAVGGPATGGMPSFMGSPLVMQALNYINKNGLGQHGNAGVNEVSGMRRGGRLHFAGGGGHGNFDVQSPIPSVGPSDPGGNAIGTALAANPSSGPPAGTSLYAGDPDDPGYTYAQAAALGLMPTSAQTSSAAPAGSSASTSTPPPTYTPPVVRPSSGSGSSIPAIPGTNFNASLKNSVNTQGMPTNTNTLSQVLGTANPTMQQIFGFNYPSIPPPQPLPYASPDNGAAAAFEQFTGTAPSGNAPTLNSPPESSPGVLPPLIASGTVGNYSQFNPNQLSNSQIPFAAPAARGGSIQHALNVARRAKARG